jgi:hypothetical protein
MQGRLLTYQMYIFTIPRAFLNTYIGDTPIITLMLFMSRKKRIRAYLSDWIHSPILDPTWENTSGIREGYNIQDIIRESRSSTGSIVAVCGDAGKHQTTTRRGSCHQESTSTIMTGPESKDGVNKAGLLAGN